jgi:hypothetical protein
VVAIGSVTAGVLACNSDVTKGNEDREGAEKSLFSLLPSVLALPALIESLFGAHVISFSA